MGIPKLLALLLIPAYVILIAVLDSLQIQAVFEPPLLLFVLNTLFLGIVPVAVAYIAGRIYFATGSSSILLTGCGMLTFGLCTIAAGSLIGMTGGPNMTVTIHNTGALVGAFLLALGSILNLVGPTSPDQRGTGKQTIATAYGCVCIFVVIYTFATVKGLVPSFFVQGVGPTILRQVVLATAVILFILSSAFFMHTYVQWKSDFLYWYSFGLALIAIGLCAIFLQTAVGSPIGWLGRSAQFLGGVFSLVAIVTAWRSARSKGLPIERVIADFLADAEASYRDLVETARDAIISFDQEGRIISWNSAAEMMFGHTKGDAIASPFLELVTPQGYSSVLEGEIRRVAAQPKRSLSERRLEMEGKRRDGSLFPIEVSASVRELPIGRLTTCIVRDVTDRKRAEEALRAGEEKYRSVVENMQDVFYRTDMQGTITMVSPSGPEMIGYESVDQIIGLNVARDFYKNPEERDRMLALLQEKGAVSNFEVELVRGDGNSIIVSTNSHIFYDKSGQPLGVEGVFSNITERKRAEKALRESETLLKEAQRAAHIGHWEIDSPTGTPTWSEEIFRIFGLDPAKGEPSFAAHQELIHPDDWDLLNNSVTRGTSQGIPFDIEFRLIRPDKSIRWMNAKGYPTGKRKGEFFRMFGTAQDITEHKQADLASLASETRYRRLFEAAKDGILILDAETGQIVDVNPFLTELLGYSREDVLEKKLWEIGIFEDTAQSQSVFAELQSKEYVRYEDLPLQKIGGEVVDVEFVSNVYLVNGSKVIQCNIRDITERKRVEEALRESEKRYRDLIQTANDIIYRTDANGFFVFFNLVGLRITGYSQEEISHKHFLDLIHPDYRNQTERFYGLQFAKRIPDTYHEVPIITKEGKTVWIGQNVQLVMEGDSVVGFQSIARDIADRKQAEES